MDRDLVGEVGLQLREDALEALIEGSVAVLNQDLLRYADSEEIALGHAQRWEGEVVL